MFSEFQNSMDLRSYRVAQFLNLLGRFQDLDRAKTSGYSHAVFTARVAPQAQF